MSQNQNLAQNLAQEYGYLPYMIERYIQFLGIDGTKKLLKANEKPLTPSIRVNTLKITESDLKKRLDQKGFKLEPIEWIPYAFKVIKETYNLGSTHEFLQGYYYLQNIASMLPALILNPKSFLRLISDPTCEFNENEARLIEAIYSDIRKRERQ